MTDFDNVFQPFGRGFPRESRDTGLPRRAERSPFDQWKAQILGRSDLTTLWSIGRAVVADMLAVPRLLALLHDCPPAYRCGVLFEAHGERWQLAQAGS